MVTFDTQKLFVGFQLEQMDTAAAADALQQLLARRKTNPSNGPKPNTLELVDKYEENPVSGVCGCGLANLDAAGTAFQPV